MRITLLGAAGIIGKDIAHRLVRAGRHDVVLADRRERDVKALAKDLQADAIPVDVRDPESLSRTLKGSDLALNATWYYFNLDVMEACLSAGCNYLDLGGLYHTTLRQLALGPRFEKEDLTAVLGAGKAPGITNILAGALAPRFERIHTVRLRSGRKALDAAPGLRLPYSAQTLIDEMTLRPVVLEDGRLRETEALARRETVRHPDPFGPIDYIATLHSELATLPGFLGRGVKNMDFCVALAPDTVATLETLIRLGLTSSEPVPIEGTKVVPRDFTVAMLATVPQATAKEMWITETEVQGTADGHPRTAVGRATGDGSRNGTAIGAMVATNLLGRGLVKEAGVHAPETAFPPMEYVRGLVASGLRVTETIVDETAVSP